MSNSCVTMEEHSSHQPSAVHEKKIINRHSWIEFNEEPMKKSISPEINQSSNSSAINLINQNEINASINTTTTSGEDVRMMGQHLPPPQSSLTGPNRTESRISSPTGGDRLTPVNFTTGGHPLASVQPGRMNTETVPAGDLQAATLRPSSTTNSSAFTSPAVSPLPSPPPSSAPSVKTVSQSIASARNCLRSPEVVVVESRVPILTNVSLKDESQHGNISRPVSTIADGQNPQSTFRKHFLWISNDFDFN